MKVFEMKKFSLLVLFWIVFFITNLNAEYALDSTLISVQPIEISSPPNPQIGDTITISAKFKSEKCTNAHSVFIFSENIKPVSYQGDSLFLYENIYLDSGVVYTKSYDVILNSVGISSISLGASLPSTSFAPHQNDIQNRIIKADMSGMFSWTFSDNDFLGDTYTEDIDPNWPGLTGIPNRRIVYRGAAKFIDVNGDNYRRPYYRYKSAYTIARIWFKLPNDNTLYHPVPLSNGEYIEGVHYAKCDDNGNFEFDISFDKDFPVSDGVKIVIMIQKNNEAINLESGTGHYEVNLDDGLSTILNLMYNFQEFDVNTYQNEQYFLKNDWPDVDQDNSLFKIHWADGPALRYCTLSRRFVKERFDVQDYSQLPFSLPTEDVVIYKNYPFAGKYNNRTNWSGPIHFKYNKQTIMVVSHEYGHYVDHAMDDFYFVGNPENTEGFAMFFSAAVAAYCNNKFGDDFGFIDNCEMAPFYYVTWDSDPSNSVRFGNMNKTLSNVNMSKFASYLWQVYDSKNDGYFMANSYFGCQDDINGYNNDDFENFGKQLFEIWIDYPNGYAINFHNYLKNRLLTQDEQDALDRIYECMDFDNDGVFGNIYPTQPKDISYQNIDVNNYQIMWESGSYENASYSRVDRGISSGQANFRNFEDGYVIEEFDNGNYIFSSSYSILDNNSVDLNKNSAYRLSSISSVNSNTSLFPISLECPFPKTRYCDFSFDVAKDIVKPNPVIDNCSLILNLKSVSYVRILLYNNQDFVSEIYSGTPIQINNEVNINCNKFASGCYFFVIEKYYQSNDKKTNDIIKFVKL